MYLRAITLVCLSIVQPFSCYQELNADGNVIFEYLGIDPESVSRHKITKIGAPRLHKRDLQQGTALTFQSIDEEISLWLRPTHSLLASDETPVYYAYGAPGYPNNVYIEKVDGAMKDVRELLEDPEHYASVVLGMDESGGTTVNGHLRSPSTKARLVVGSLPKDIVKGFLSDHSRIDDLIDGSDNVTYHVIVELHDNEDAQNIAMKGPRGTTVDMTIPQSTNASNANATNKQIPDTLYPQILVHVDYLFYEPWSGKSLSSLLEYILTFWNGVDLIYRQVENPKIRFNIAGIVISKDLQATPFFEGNEIQANVSYNSSLAGDAATYFYYHIEKESPIVAFDVSAVMTTMEGISKPHQLNKTVLGFAWGIGNICNRDDSIERNNALTMIMDRFPYGGVSTAAHEIAHLLGAQHEDHPTHTQCTQRNGTLMDAVKSLVANFTGITSCTLQDIRAAFNKGSLDCLFNVPQMAGTRLPGLMPGKAMNIVKQCQYAGYPLPCYPAGKYVDMCTALWCVTKNQNTIGCTKTSSSAAPGTVCVKENSTEYGICFHNRCV